MALITSALQSLIDAGSDAQSNLYEVTFSGGKLGDNTDDLTIRCSGFTPVFPTQSTYSVAFVTAKIERPVTKIDLTRNFSITFRSDDNWKLYQKLLEQQALTMHASKSYVNHRFESIKDNLFNVNVNRLQRLGEVNDNTVQLFHFRYCWISEITSPDFSTQDASPVTINCKINFLAMEDIQSGFKSTSQEQDADYQGFTMYNNENTKYV